MPAPDDRFRYDGYAVDAASGVVRCTYSTGTHTFTEQFEFGRDGSWDEPAVAAAVRILYLLTGVSYYKTTAPPVVDLGDCATTSGERDFLADYFRAGLGEFAYRNGLDLDALVVTGPDAVQPDTVDYAPVTGRPLIPFGGGIDSIVTAVAVAREHPESCLFVMHPPTGRFAAIEDAAAATGLPVRRAVRTLDPQVQHSAALGFLNGHVPVTAIVTAAALVAAVLDGRDAVVLSNEWSASVPTLVAGARSVNHQWSKGEEFERRFGDLVAEHLGPQVAVFSYLRPRTELWVAEQFAALTAFPLLSQLQSRLSPGPLATPRPLVRVVRQVLLHRSGAGSLHGAGAARRRLRWLRTIGEPRERAAVPRPGRTGTGPATFRMRGRCRRVPGCCGAGGAATGSRRERTAPTAPR